ALDGSLTRIVGGQRERRIPVEVVQQTFQLAYPSIDVLRSVIRIAHVIHAGGRGHQLHQSHGPLAGDGAGIEVGLNLDQGTDEVGIDVMTGGSLVDIAVDLGGAYRTISGGLRVVGILRGKLALDVSLVRIQPWARLNVAGHLAGNGARRAHGARRCVTNRLPALGDVAPVDQFRRSLRGTRGRIRGRLRRTIVGPDNASILRDRLN